MPTKQEVMVEMARREKARRSSIEGGGVTQARETTAPTQAAPSTMGQVQGDIGRYQRHQPGGESADLPNMYSEQDREVARQEGFEIPRPYGQEVPRSSMEPEGYTRMVFRNNPESLSASETTGATAGAALVGMRAPVPAQAAAGMLGAAIGGAVHRAGMEVEDFVRLPEYRKAVLTGDMSAAAWAQAGESRAAEALGLAGTEAGVQMGVIAATRAVSGAFQVLGKLAGVVSPNVVSAINRLMVNAESQKINFSAAEINSGFTRSTLRVMSVMPVLGRKYRQQQEIKGLQVDRRLKTMLDEAHPYVDDPTLSTNIFNSAVQMRDARAQIGHYLYSNMWDTISKHGDPAVIPTQGIHDAALEVLSEMGAVASKSGQVGLRTNAPGEVASMPTVDENFLEALRAYTNLAPNARPSEVRAAQANLVASSKKYGGEMKAVELDAVDRLRHAVNESLTQADWTRLVRPAAVSAPGSVSARRAQGAVEDITNSIQEANGFWSNMKYMTSVAAARPLTRIDANFWRTGYDKPGTVDLDELLDVYVSDKSSIKSPEFIEDLKALVGQENVSALGRRLITKAFALGSAQTDQALAMPADPGMFRKAMRVLRMSEDRPKREGLVPADARVFTFDPVAVRQRLGLGGDGQGMARKALDSLLEGTNLNASQIENFLDISERVMQEQIQDPSSFLARRLVLSGKISAGLGLGGVVAGGAVAGQAAGSGAVGGGFVALGALLVSAEALNHLLTTPQGLKILRDGLKPNLGRQEMIKVGLRYKAFMGDGADADWSVDEPSISDE